MAHLLRVAPHLTPAELENRYLACVDVGERERLHCVLLKQEGRSSRDIATFFRKREDWVRRVVRRYNERGPDAMKDGRRHNGSPRMLDEASIKRLEEALRQPHPDGGLWSGPKVAAWIAEHVGVECTNRTGWAYLRRLGYTIQRPRPKHPDADPKAQEAFKKGGFPTTFLAWLEPIPTR
ncbi:MAG: IS630 family transposase [Deltaproteobacteria bacterium]|nr:MAG: IS630 family transposase [Deltaproteobacteria bacterium]